MSLYCKRQIVAQWKRPKIRPDHGTVIEDKGFVMIGVPTETTVAQAEPFITAETGQFEAIIDPRHEIEQGDILIFDNTVHSVIAIRRSWLGKTNDYGEVELKRKEVPALFPETGEAAPAFIEEEFTAQAGRTEFWLLSYRVPGGIAIVAVNGIVYPEESSYILEGNRLTWKNVPFALQAGDRVVVKYQVS